MLQALALFESRPTLVHCDDQTSEIVSLPIAEKRHEARANPVAEKRQAKTSTQYSNIEERHFRRRGESVNFPWPEIAVVSGLIVESFIAF